jgi:hypothetical protein
MAQHALARTDLEALLRARKLDRTVQPADAEAEAGQAKLVPGTRLPTGHALLDTRLEGGLPRGQVSEIVGPRSSGRTTLMCSLLAAATRRGELAALVDPLDSFDPPSAASCGIVLERLLWLRGEGSTMGTVGRREHEKLERLLDRSVKALNLVLQAGGFDLVALDLGGIPPDALRRLPFTTWFRLQRVIEGSRTACLLVGPAPIARGADGVSLQLAGTGRWQPAPQGSQRWNDRLFLGFDIQARIVRARDAREHPCHLAANASCPDTQRSS